MPMGRSGIAAKRALRFLQALSKISNLFALLYSRFSALARSTLPALPFRTQDRLPDRALTSEQPSSLRASPLQHSIPTASRCTFPIL